VKRLMAELLLQGLAFGNVLEGHHRAHYLALLEYRGAHVVDREARAVLSSEHFVIPTARGPVLERRMDRALLKRIGGAIRFRVVEDVV
jgi:hypothetical protein